MQINDQVKLINQIAGKSVTADRRLLLEQCRIIQSELTETFDALVKGDWPEFRDGVSDTEFTSLGLFGLSPFDYNADMQVVCNSNMEKFDTSKVDALKTKAKYEKIGIETYCHEMSFSAEYLAEKFNLDNGGANVTYYVTKSAKDQIDAKGKDYPADKWLKSYKWQEPVFKPMDEGDTLEKMQTWNEEFDKPLEDSVYYEYSSQVEINQLVAKQGGKRVLDLVKRGLESEQKKESPLLMSVNNPTGWKLEELLEKVRIELESKNIALKNKLYNLPAGEVGQTKDIVMQCAQRNNSDILELLTRAIVLQKNNMEQFDRLGADQGPTGTPRIFNERCEQSRAGEISEEDLNRAACAIVMAQLEKSNPRRFLELLELAVKAEHENAVDANKT